MLFEIFHIVYAFTPNAEHLGKFILPAKNVYILCLKFNISFKYHYFHQRQYEEINFGNFIGRMLKILFKQLGKAFRELSGHTDVVFPTCCLVAKSQ